MKRLIEKASSFGKIRDGKVGLFEKIDLKKVSHNICMTNLRSDKHIKKKKDERKSLNEKIASFKRKQTKKLIYFR